MNTVLFDTLAYSKRLKTAGFTEQQAEVQAEALAEIIENQFVTKGDLKGTEQRINIKLGGIIAASIAITVALLKLF